MRLPRNLSGLDLAKNLDKIGYHITRQTGSHMRLTCKEGTEHHVTIPAHSSLRVGTLSSIINDIATHLKMERKVLLKKIFSE